jgi:hypothetical protein
MDIALYLSEDHIIFTVLSKHNLDHLFLLFKLLLVEQELLEELLLEIKRDYFYQATPQIIN